MKKVQKLNKLKEKRLTKVGKDILEIKKWIKKQKNDKSFKLKKLFQYKDCSFNKKFRSNLVKKFRFYFRRIHKKEKKLKVLTKNNHLEHTLSKQMIKLKHQIKNLKKIKANYSIKWNLCYFKVKNDLFVIYGEEPFIC